MKKKSLVGSSPDLPSFKINIAKLGLKGSVTKKPKRNLEFSFSNFSFSALDWDGNVYDLK